jgi:hypothetical protein
MTADELLSLVSGLGLQIRLSGDGELRLHGPRQAVTPSLLSLLQRPGHREDLRERLSTRRIVLLANDGSLEKVLAAIAPGHEFARLYAECSHYPGRVLAAEWLDTTHGRHQWVRFLTKFG